MNTAESFTHALERHRAGDLATAEAYYRAVLAVHDQHAGAWHLLGVVHTQRGQPEQAVAYIDRAIALNPTEGGFHLNRGVAFQALGRLPEAEACFRRAVELAPGIAEAHNNLANTLYARAARTEARHHWAQALAIQPNYAEAHVNLARALADSGAWAQAEQHLLRAAHLSPDSAATHFQHGAVLARLRHCDRAAESYRLALELRPDWPAALCGLGQVLHEHQDLPGAEAHLRQALRIAPDLAEAHNALGHLLGGQGRLPEATAHLRQAVARDPANPEAQHNLGLAYKLQRHWPAAAAHLRQALRLRPDFSAAAVQLSDVLAFQGDLDEALTVVQAALREKPDEGALLVALGETAARQGRVADSAAAFRRALERDPQAAVAHSCFLNALNFDPTQTPAQLLAAHRQWATSHAQVEPLPATFDRTPNRRLRVGYVSGDLIQHVLVHFFEPILTHHDPAAVDVFVYADVAAADAVTARLRVLAPQWRPICGRTDAAVAQLVHTDRVDILVDLGGHTGARLGVLARRPAPVQGTYLGYPNTTGLDQIQFRLTDAIADPPGEVAAHTEALVRVPGGFCCYHPPREAPDVTPLPTLAAGHFTFGGLHKLAKLNEGVLDLWSAVLRSVPSARLLLFRDVLRGATADRFRAAFTARGIAPDRVQLEHQVPHSSFLAVYGGIDLALDTLPWNGHATACEALWMGVPTLTLRGNRHAGRMVASVLTQVDLTEFIAGTPEAFVARAVAWAQQRERLAALRRGLREQVRNSPLCDGRNFTRRLETLYRSLWNSWADAPAPSGYVPEGTVPLH